MSIYQILDDQGDVVNTIVADESFVEAAYPGHYRLAPEPVPDYSEANKSTASTLLTETDWVEMPSVIDSANNPHLLNQADFLAYRSQLRAIAVNPPSTEWTPPEKPTEVWSA